MSKIIEHYVLENILGAGQFGKVYKAKNTKDNNYYAIKSIKRQIFDDNPKMKEFTVNEIHTLTKISNEHVVKFIEMIKTNNNFYFIYEFCNGGTLEDDLFARGYFTEKEAKPLFKQIVKGLDSVTKLNIIHRDLKPQNILYHNGRIKIADFGFCKPMQSKNQMTKTVLGSPIYMAPEILRGDDYTMKADIWSLGVLFYEMLFGKCPYEGRSIANLINLIDESPLIFLDNNLISENLKQLLREMLCKDPKRRIEWEKLYDIVMETSTIIPNITNLNSNELLYQEIRKPFANLNVFIPQNSPTKKYENQTVSLDNTPSIELNTTSFNQTIVNLNNESNFSKPLNTEKNISCFMKNNTNPGEIIINPNNTSNYPNYEKKRDSLHSSFHKNRLELIFSKIYKIEITKAILTSDSLLQFLRKERNKLFFLSKIFYELNLFKLMSRSEIFEVIFHKYLYLHAKNFKEMLLDHISLDSVHLIANYSDLCNSYECKFVMNLYKKEMEKIINTFQMHRDKMIFNKDLNSIEKIEIEGVNSFNLNNFYKNILNYIISVKENFLFSKEEKYKSEDSLKYMIHAIEMLDSVLLNELFDGFIDEEENFESQKYFLDLRKAKFSGLLKMLNIKIDYFKRKYLQE